MNGPYHYVAAEQAALDAAEAWLDHDELRAAYHLERGRLHAQLATAAALATLNPNGANVAGAGRTAKDVRDWESVLTITEEGTTP